MKLLIVDGSNVVLRCAWGGDIDPPEAVRSAASMIERVAGELRATHLIICMDMPGEPTWRHQLYPEYKATRKIDTSPWILSAGMEFGRQGWHVECAKGFEADDIIATIALRIGKRAEVAVLSSDSDLLPLTVAGISVIRPLAGGQTQSFDAAGAAEKYKIPSPYLLYDLKAMMGEVSDNIPGVPGIGPKRASDLINRYGDLDAIIEVGKGRIEKYSAIVAEHEAAARLSLKLVSLNPDAPIAPISPSLCAFVKPRANAA